MSRRSAISRSHGSRRLSNTAHCAGTVLVGVGLVEALPNSGKPFVHLDGIVVVFVEVPGIPAYPISDRRVAEQPVARENVPPTPTFTGPFDLPTSAPEPNRCPRHEQSVVIDPGGGMGRGKRCAGR